MQPIRRKYLGEGRGACCFLSRLAAAPEEASARVYTLQMAAQVGEGFAGDACSRYVFPPVPGRPLQRAVDTLARHVTLRSLHMRVQSSCAGDIKIVGGMPRSKTVSACRAFAIRMCVVERWK